MIVDSDMNNSEIGERIRRRYLAFATAIGGKYAASRRARGRARLWHLQPRSGSTLVRERLIDRRVLVERWLLQPFNLSVALQYEEALGSNAAALFGASNCYPSSGRDRVTVARPAHLLPGVPRQAVPSSGFDVGARTMKSKGFLGAAFLPNVAPFPARAGEKQQTSVESRPFHGLIFRDAHLFSNPVLADFVPPVLRHKDVLRLLAVRHVEAPRGTFPRRREFNVSVGFAPPGEPLRFQRHRDGSLVPAVRAQGSASPAAQRIYADVRMPAAMYRRVEMGNGVHSRIAGGAAMKSLRGNAELVSQQPRVPGVRALAGMGEQPEVESPGSLVASLARDGGPSLSHRARQGVPRWRNRLNFVDQSAADSGAAMGRRALSFLLTRVAESSAVGRASAGHVGLQPDLRMAMSEPEHRAAPSLGVQTRPTNIVVARNGAAGTSTHLRSTVDLRTFAMFEQRSFPLRNGNASEFLLREAGAMQGKPPLSALGNGGGIAHVVARGRTAAGVLTLPMRGARMLPAFAAASRWARFVALDSAPSDGARGRATADLVLRPAVPPGAGAEVVAQKSVTQTTVASRVLGASTNTTLPLDIERIAQQVQTLLERKARIERTRRGL